MPSFLWSSVTTSTPFLLLLASEKHTLIKPKMEFKCKWFLNGDFCCNVVVVESVMSDSLQPHRLKHSRLPCPSLSPGVCSNSCPLSRWCHPAILCFPLLLLPPVFPSIRVFSNESALCITWPKYWNFSFSISPSNEYSGLIFFRIDRFDLLAVQGTLKSLLQHHNLKALIIQCSAFFMVNSHICI